MKNAKNNIETALSKLLKLPVRATILQHKLTHGFFCCTVSPVLWEMFRFLKNIKEMNAEIVNLF